MKIEESVVMAARLGGKAEFAAIVRTYEKSLYSFALASTRSVPEAEDAVQEIFLKVLVGIRDVRNESRFESWLWSVARNELSSRGRKGLASSRIVDIDPDELDGEGGSWGAGMAGEAREGEDLLGGLFSQLRPEEALAAALKYGGGFSVREVALVCGIAESTAKGRLDMARRRMRALAGRGGQRRRLGPGAPGPVFGIHRFRIPFGLEERIMDNVETLRLGASIIERLANDDQMHLASLSRRGEAFDERSLSAIGEVAVDGDGTIGAEFVRRVASRLNVKEFASMLNYTDRYTEKRIIEGLETVDKETSEQLKRNMFVFEDFVLFDDKALSLLVDEVGEDLFAAGLAACGIPVRDELLANLGEKRVASLRAAIARSTWSIESARAAQEEAVAFARRLDKEGRLKVIQSADYPRGFIFTVPG